MVSLTPQPPPCLGGKVLRDKEKPFYGLPEKNFQRIQQPFSQEKIFSLTQALDILICMHGYGHICIAIDMPAKYHTQA